MVPEVWRLLPITVAEGSTHMAIDAWLLDQLILGHQKPTLRFYRWLPAAISLGYHQRQWPDHWQHLIWQGRPVDLVRRSTGGRAVLHQGDFTYAITLPIGTHRRQVLYKRVCTALISGFGRLGISLDYGTAGRGYRHQPSCFALATAADLVTPSGHKLIGSAQLRRDRYLLQHGTLPLWTDPELYHQVFGGWPVVPAPPIPIPDKPSEPWLSALAGILVEEFENTLGITFVEEPLTPAEEHLAITSHGQGTTP